MVGDGDSTSHSLHAPSSHSLHALTSPSLHAPSSHSLHAAVQLTDFGRIIEGFIKRTNALSNGIFIDRYVIMPDHVHMIIVVDDNNSGAPSPTGTRQNQRIPAFISMFKRFTNKQIGYNIWQRSYYDHIIRDESDYERICRYIAHNPENW